MELGRLGMGVWDSGCRVSGREGQVKRAECTVSSPAGRVWDSEKEQRPYMPHKIEPSISPGS